MHRHIFIYVLLARSYRAYRTFRALLARILAYRVEITTASVLGPLDDDFAAPEPWRGTKKISF